MFEAVKNLFRRRETMKGFQRRKPDNYKGRVTYDKSKCTKCHICVKYCPANAIKIGEEGYIEVDHEKCIRCALCVALCPSKALRMVKK